MRWSLACNAEIRHAQYLPGRRIAKVVDLTESGSMAENGPWSYFIARTRWRSTSSQAELTIELQTRGSPPSAQATQTSGVYLFVLPSTKNPNSRHLKSLSGPGRATVLHFTDSKVAIAMTYDTLVDSANSNWATCCQLTADTVRATRTDLVRIFEIWQLERREVHCRDTSMARRKKSDWDRSSVAVLVGDMVCERQSKT